MAPTRIGDLEVPPVGLGLMSLGHIYGHAGSDDERVEFLDYAVKAGATHWDCADIYGDAEDIIGKWLKRDPSNRSKVTIATKFGFYAEDGGMPTNINGKPEYVKVAVEKSLGRMGIDQIDLLYLHRADVNVPIELTVGAMAELVKEGKARYLGLSEASVDTLRRAHAVHPISALQVEYSAFNLAIEKNGVKKAAEELGVAIIAYSPIGRGILTGEIKSYDDLPKDDWRRWWPKFQADNWGNINALVASLDAVAKKYNATSSQIALAWLTTRGTSASPVIPIPGTSKARRLDENHGASKIQLSAEDVETVGKAVQKAEDNIKGDAYPAGMQELLFVDTPPLAA